MDIMDHIAISHVKRRALNADSEVEIAHVILPQCFIV